MLVTMVVCMCVRISTQCRRYRWVIIVKRLISALTDWPRATLDDVNVSRELSTLLTLVVPTRHSIVHTRCTKP